jgi:hypothetical protein
LVSVIVIPLGPGARTLAVEEVTLLEINDHLYQTEHALFIIDMAGRVAWPDYDSVFSDANIDYYSDELLNHFPFDFTTVVIIANDLVPNNTPNYLGSGPQKATGINVSGGGFRPFDICRYNIGGGTVNRGALAVLDHELGHGWGPALPPLEGAHWSRYSTVIGQMAGNYSDDGYRTVKQIHGDELDGFRWESMDNLYRNERETYSENQLYVMGLHPVYPATYLLNDPVYNPDETMSYSSFERQDHESIVASFGSRVPDYRSSKKRFKIGFVYVARDLDEVQGVHAQIEESIRFFSYAEEIDSDNYRFEVPFLAVTRLRASVDSRLADLDGNSSPSLEIFDGYVAIPPGVHYTSIDFDASDPDGPSPLVECVSHPDKCGVLPGRLLVGPMRRAGTFFFTVGATDGGGKKAFGHFVIDVGSAECNDTDGDGYGYPPSTSCTYPDEDCDDGDGNAFPGNGEECEDGSDNDCDTFVDCDDEDCRLDIDLDTHLASPCGNDCDDGDGEVWQVPVEVESLRWTSKTLLVWDDLSDQAGWGTGYDIIKGHLDELPVGGLSETCLGTSPNTSFTDPTTLLDTPLYYVVRGTNACPDGRGPYGSTSTDTSRESTACP